MADPIQSLFFVAEPVASGVHLVGALVACALTPALLRLAGESRRRRVSLGVFAASVVFLFTVSGVYHVFEMGTGTRSVLQRLDHAGIWLTTAGCATTLWYFFIRHLRAGTLFLAGVWIVALGGTLLKTVFFEVIPDRYGVLFFVAFGSLGIPVVIWLVASRGLYFVRWFFCCGVFLTVGALLEMIEEPTLLPGIVGYHELVHVFVMAGLFFQWAFVYGLAVAESGELPAAEVGAHDEPVVVNQ